MKSSILYQIYARYVKKIQEKKIINFKKLYKFPVVSS